MQTSCHKCSWCKFWTQRKIGDCSQNMITTDGVFIKPQTTEDYGCNAYEYDTAKMKVTFWQDEDGEIHTNGTYSKTYLHELKIKLEEMTKEF